MDDSGGKIGVVLGAKGSAVAAADGLLLIHPLRPGPLQCEACGRVCGRTFQIDC